MEPLLSVRHLTKTYPARSGSFHEPRRKLLAVDNVSFDLYPGETLGLVGESGCGKSTTGKLILRLIEPDSGEVIFDRRSLTSLTRRELRPLRREMQMIFQDPYASLNPRMKVWETVGEPMLLHGLANRSNLRDQAARLLETVGLSVEHLDRYPHEFSGGQRQRIGIARALAGRPRLIVADEPVSALDLSIQAQVLNLLQEIQEQFNLTYLFIAHDLAVVEHISTRVAVMYLGRIVELAPADRLYHAPLHPYSAALLDAVPVPNPRHIPQRHPLKGEVPSPLDPPKGCTFHPRCPYAADICHQVVPPLNEYAPRHAAACHFAGQLHLR